MSAQAASRGAAGGDSPPPSPPPAALVWLRCGDLRLADNEPLHAACASMAQASTAAAAAQGDGHGSQPPPLLLPFFVLDDTRGLAPQAGSLLRLPAMGPHQLRLLLEAAADVRASLRARGSDLLWSHGRPEAMVGRLVALAAAAGASQVALFHHQHPGRRASEAEAAVAAAFHTAAAQHGLEGSLQRYWGSTLHHPDDLPFTLFPGAEAGSGDGGDSSSSSSSSTAAAGAGGAAGAGVDARPERLVHLPPVMTDFRRALRKARTPVRPPLPAPAAASGGSGGSSSGAPVLPPLPPAVASAAAAAGLTEPLPTDLAASYAAAGPEAQAALARWEALTELRCAELPPAGSAQHDPRSAAPFAMGEAQALQRLRHFLGLPQEGSSSSSSSSSSDGGSSGAAAAGHPPAAAAAPAAGAAAAPPIVGYQGSRMLAWGQDSSAKMSAFLALGCISPRAVHAELLRLAAADAAAAGGGGGDLGLHEEPGAGDTWRWLLMHLAIRDFFVFSAQREGDALERPEGLASGKAVDWRHDEALLRRWVLGQTGLPFVDACMRELRATGYTSNRGRQNVASFLSKALGLDWRWGAEAFAALLGDHEEGLNRGNWAYNSGAGSDPRDRTFRTVSQGLKYDEQAALIHAWLPELSGLPAELAHQPWAAPPQALAAAGVRLGEGPDAAAAGGAGAAAEPRWYPLPLVDPVTQLAKGPGPRQQRRQRQRAGG